MSKFMAKNALSALALGCVMALPSCGCKKEEAKPQESVQMPAAPAEMPKAVDAQDAQVVEQAPAAVEEAPAAAPADKVTEVK